MGILTALLEVIAGLVIAFLLFYRFWFLMDPVRKIPQGNNIVSPADGKVIDIKEVKGNAEINKGKGVIEANAKKRSYMITIFMTPFDVHYQRAPYDGVVEDIKYTKGKFRSAEKPRPGNENNQILIKTGIGEMTVIQIAGFIARRIVCFVKKNQKIKKGEKIGLIKLGSQVCLVMPVIKNKLLVKTGDKVKAGETIIAEL